MLPANQNPTELNYLTLFHNNYSRFIQGIYAEDDFNDNAFLYRVLCVDFVGYGLLEKVIDKDLQTNKINISYQISDNGQKFYSLLEKAEIYK
jgi:hypothetical protein